MVKKPWVLNKQNQLKPGLLYPPKFHILRFKPIEFNKERKDYLYQKDHLKTFSLNELRYSANEIRNYENGT